MVPLSTDLAFIQGCKEIGQALDMPPDAILSGILLLVSFFTSHCVITVPGTVWVEPAILWISITMPTGSGKTPLFTFLTNILQKVRSKLNLTQAHPPWLLDEASFEKMGELMATNHSELLGLYDELSTSWLKLMCSEEEAFLTLTIYLHSYHCILGSHGHAQPVSSWQDTCGV